LLATDKVRFTGDPVAIVIAESRYLAEDGCELVEVDYDDLPPVVAAAFALGADSPPLSRIWVTASPGRTRDTSPATSPGRSPALMVLSACNASERPHGGTRLRRELGRRPSGKELAGACQVSVSRRAETSR
jgi:CO/xanthine dehydrogenase Mo-binding subunit